MVCPKKTDSFKRKTHIKSKAQIKRSYQPLFSWPNSANRLIRKLEDFGYIGYKSGVCHGVACVAAHAMLLNEIDEFDRDLQRIKAAKVDETKKQLDERTFLEAIELCHQPDEYPQLFSTYARNRKIKPAQHALISFPLVESPEISAQGGIVSAGVFSGVYDYKGVVHLFQILRLMVEKLARPMAMLLSDEGHIIAVQYQPVEKIWIFVDSRSLPSRKYARDEDVARVVSGSLTCSLKRTVMSVLLLVTKKNQCYAKKAVAKMQRSREWKKLHQLNEDNALYLQRWLFVAAYEGCEKEVAFLLANHVHPNGPVLRNLTPLIAAATQGNLGVVRLLLEHGACVNDPRERLQSPLFVATQSGYDEVVVLLRKYGAKFKKGEAVQLRKDAAL